ncbi:MAG: hypothetical protein RL215_2516 [Planctomycetota bacterium]|jgi:hypothetical protein|nr:hypothetical protein [Acidobacteriota bacterium]
MADDYYLAIQSTDSNLVPTDVLNHMLLSNGLGAVCMNNLFKEYGFSINAFADNDEASVFGGTRPDVCISFRLNKRFSSSGLAEDRMLALVAWLIRESSADMRLSYNADVVLMERRSMRLLIFTESDFWTATRVRKLREAARDW